MIRTERERVTERLREKVLELFMTDKGFQELVQHVVNKRWEGIMDLRETPQDVIDELVCMDQVTLGNEILSGVFGGK